MKKKILLFIMMLLLPGCVNSTPKDIELDEWEMSSALQNGRSARIGNTVLYDCSQDYGTYIKLENSNDSKKLDAVSQNFAIDKISSSNQYFYLSGRETSDKWGGKSNVLVLDANGKVITAKNCCCEWIYICGNTVLGYYNGHNELDSAMGWVATRMEVTHCLSEEAFLKNEDNEIRKWKALTGDVCSIDEKKLFHQKDSEHSVPYYTDTVYYSAYDVLKEILYVDGKLASDLDEETAKKYIEQLYGIMGGREKNFGVSSWQFGSKLFGVCCIYRKSGGFLQHFTKDIERSLVFCYDPDKDSIYLEKTYDGKELAYCDEDWMIFRKDREVFIENIRTHQSKKIFESDAMVTVDLSGDVITVWDTDNEGFNHSDAVILQ